MPTISALYRQGTAIASNPKHTRWLSPLLLVLDAFLCALIIWKIPYTEIDWKAYMQQISKYVAGQRNYAKIHGGTGPLVYPAAHVYIYRALYEVTNKGRNILLAQSIFAVLYLMALAVVMACYRLAKAPPYIFPMLVLSKRLHSIFVLRCFNDCFAVFFLWVAIYAYQRRAFTIGSLVYSWGLGVKMSLLLPLPALGVVIFLTRGVATGIRQVWLMLQLQLLIGLPFLFVNAQAYFNRAFEFSRQFLFKWTVNWRFVGKDTFRSKNFSNSLLIGHAMGLMIFALMRWLKPAGRPLPTMIARLARFQEPLGDIQQSVSRRITPQFILTTVLTANIIGILFARSLHYQFYTYVAWASPFLLWRSGLHPLLQYVLWGAQEWAWNVYPSTDASSMVVVGVLATTLIALLLGTAGERFPEVKDARAAEDRWYIKLRVGGRPVSYDSKSDSSEGGILPTVDSSSSESSGYDDVLEN